MIYGRIPVDMQSKDSYLYWNIPRGENHRTRGKLLQGFAIYVKSKLVYTHNKGGWWLVCEEYLKNTNLSYCQSVWWQVCL